MAGSQNSNLTDIQTDWNNMALLHYDIAGSQIDGARDYQEDAFLITHLSSAEDDQQALAIVADGMGGHAAGNVASNMAVQAFNKHISSNYPVNDATLIPDILRTSITKANDAIKETVNETEALSGMGCTIVGALLADDKLWWASVGDSHLYLIREKEITKLNADHSYGGFLDRMAAKGKHIEADPSLSRNMLMSALTGGEIAEIDVSTTPFGLQPNDYLIIASDGLDTLVGDEIIKQCGWSPDSKETAAALLKAVEDVQRPRQDNATVISVKTGLVESSDPSVPGGAASDTYFTVDDDYSDSSSGAGFGKIAAAIAVLAIGGVVAADFFMKLGIIFPKPVVVAEVEKIIDRPAETVAEPDDSEDTATTEPQLSATGPDISAEPKAVAKPRKKRPHFVVPFNDALRNGSTGPIMVTIPGGEFMMGAGSLSVNLDERPQHKVKIKEFAISQYEITYSEYERFTKATGKRPPERVGVNPRTQPVVEISWQDAQDYISWLSRQTSHKYSLPTEAQWEYAARAGTTTLYWWGRDAGDNNAHCIGCGSPASLRQATPIGSFDPNPWGLYDTSGNVAEWTEDCYNRHYNGAPTDGSAWYDGDCSKRVARGGSFSNASSGVTNTRREKYNAGTKLTHIGFRIVRENN